MHGAGARAWFLDQRQFVGHGDFMRIGGASPNPHGITLVVMLHPAAGAIRFALEVRALDLDGVVHAETMLLEGSKAFRFAAATT